MRDGNVALADGGTDGQASTLPGLVIEQEKLLQALTRGLSDIASVEPWMTSFNPGTSTLERLIELTREVDFAALIAERLTQWKSVRNA